MSIGRTPPKGYSSIVAEDQRRLPTAVTLTPQSPEEAAEQLHKFLIAHPKVFVLTGAGISTDSGIPDYRDNAGAWKRKAPVQHHDFMHDHYTRQRYWGRSLIGWPVMRNAQPNVAHECVAELERQNTISLLVTQNVDRLHQRAGSERVIDLHGRSDEVLCMSCGWRTTREGVHAACADLNPDFMGYTARTAPDGDADLEVDFSQFSVPHCEQCGGILKPDVVFFGDNVPKARVQMALEALRASDGLLVIGSSLMVYSGFRFCRHAHDWGLPIATLNLGQTRADELVTLKMNARISETLDRVRTIFTGN
ncbi:NAD-dependent protein deacetylase [Salinispirillum sp. LH 10-3-1]|uniref:NAD-dependent protein deacetylase n=1 Tax=Salinispirillum sp. LH 10-3-1 TaxID=2952525 RepID=A0AB38YBH3_9GAMM